MNDISHLVTEVDIIAPRIVNATDRTELKKQIKQLDTAWKWGKRSDIKRHAELILRIVETYRNKDRSRFSETFLLDIEAIYTGRYVPPSRTSSTRPNSVFKSRSPQHLSDEKNRYEKKKNEGDSIHTGLSEQLGHEEMMYLKMKKENDELTNSLEKKKFAELHDENDELKNRLSQQLSVEKNKNEKLRNEYEETNKRLAHQLRQEKNKCEQLKNETEEKHKSLSEQLRQEKERCEKLQNENVKLLNRFSKQLSEERNTFEKLKNEKDEVHRRLSQQLSDIKKKYEQLRVENHEMHNRLSQQLSEEQNKYERMKNEKEDIYKRVSYQISELQNKYDKLNNEKDGMHKRLTEQLNHEKRQYETLKTEINELRDSLSHQLSLEKNKNKTLKTEKDEMFQSLSGQLSHEKKMYLKTEKEKDELLNSLSDQLSHLKRQYHALDKEKDELLNRLSQHVSAKLTKDNPDITDLSDIYRPTKLGEMYSELYDNEWTDAYELLTETRDEKEAIKILIDVLTISYSYCLRHSKTQHMLVESVLILPVTTFSVIEEPTKEDLFEHVTKSVLTGRQALGDIEQKLVVDLRKATKGMSVDNVVKEGVNAVMSRWAITDPSDHFRSYVQQCLRISWLMCQQSPRMFIEVDIAKYSGAMFDKSTFKEYMKTGKNIDYVVWLPLFLHEGGNLIRKGVANGK